MKKVVTFDPVYLKLILESRQGEDIFSSPDRIWSLSSLLFNGYRRSFPEVKRPGREMDYPPQSSAEVKISGTVPLLPPICLHSRDNFAFALIASFPALEVLCHVFSQISNINLLNRKPWSCNLYPGRTMCKDFCEATTIA